MSLSNDAIKDKLERFLSVAAKQNEMDDEQDAITEDLMKHYQEQIDPECFSIFESLMETLDVFPNANAAYTVLESLVTTCAAKPVVKSPKKKRAGAGGRSTNE